MPRIFFFARKVINDRISHLARAGVPDRDRGVGSDVVSAEFGRTN
jgi:hypothetical protein